MLTADLIRPRLQTRGGEISTRPLSPQGRTLQRTAAELIQIFQAHVGCARRELDAALEEYEGARLDYVILRGLSKVLLDDAVFAAEPPVDPVALRTALFESAAQHGPVLYDADRSWGVRRGDLIAEIAAHYNVAAQDVEESLFADLLEEQILSRLKSAWTPADLIARYNLELARGLLYWASEMRITVGGGYKDLFKYIKLFKLMHEIRPLGEDGHRHPHSGYHVTIDGPISPFVSSTIRYGGQMALFLPALMLCPDWTMEADIQSPWQARSNDGARTFRYSLDSSAALRSHYKASDAFDSKLEEDFAREFEEKFTRTERKWVLAREDEIVPVGDTVMIPDFSFTHVKDGRRALVELAGFWHKEYLRRKAWKLRQAGRTDLVLVAYRSVNTTDETWKDVPGEVLLFTSKPVIKDVLAAVERCAVLPEEMGRT